MALLKRRTMESVTKELAEVVERASQYRADAEARRLDIEAAHAEHESIIQAEVTGDLSADAAAEASAAIGPNVANLRTETDRLERVAAGLDERAQSLRDEIAEFEAIKRREKAEAAAHSAAAQSDVVAGHIRRLSSEIERLEELRHVADATKAAAYEHATGLVDEAEWPAKTELQRIADVLVAGPRHPHARAAAESARAERERAGAEERAINHAVQQQLLNPLNGHLVVQMVPQHLQGEVRRRVDAARAARGASS